MVTVTANGFMKWCSVNEDISSGNIPDEITYRGYTTKNLHHSEDARRAFLDTIRREQRGELHNDPKTLLNALKATDTYMGYADVHLEQDAKPLDSRELDKWKVAHQQARDALLHLGEFLHHEDYWHIHEHEIQALMTQYNPETAGDEMADSYQPQGNQLHEVDSNTFKVSDKHKVARVLAGMLGVEDAETMSPDVAVNTGLRNLRKQRITPEMHNVVSKLVDLARQVGIKVQSGVVKEQSMMSLKDYIDFVNKADSLPEQVPILPNVSITELDPTEVGHTFHPQKAGAETRDDHVRRMKVKYKTDEQTLPGEEEPTETSSLKPAVVSADYKTTKTGKKYRAHRIVFEEVTDELPELTDDDLSKLAKSITDPEHILHLYDDDELTAVDGDDEVLSHVKEEVLDEVMSRVERIRARVRFLRNAPKRERRMQIALKRHSDAKTINKRARRLAISLIKQKIMKKPAAELSVQEKERVEGIIARMKPAIDRLSLKLVPRIRKIEQDRLTHATATETR